MTLTSYSTAICRPETHTGRVVRAGGVRWLLGLAVDRAVSGAVDPITYLTYAATPLDGEPGYWTDDAGKRRRTRRDATAEPICIEHAEGGDCPAGGAWYVTTQYDDGTVESDPRDGELLPSGVLRGPSPHPPCGYEAERLWRSETAELAIWIVGIDVSSASDRPWRHYVTVAHGWHDPAGAGRVGLAVLAERYIGDWTFGEPDVRPVADFVPTAD